MAARVRRVPGKPAILSLRVLSRQRGKKVIAFFLRRNWRQARVLGVVLSVPDLLVPGEAPADVVPAGSLGFPASLGGPERPRTKHPGRRGPLLPH